MYDIIIIGAGPAGMTAAVYARRYGRSVLVIEKEGIGGQIASSPKVENYPGFQAVSGIELSDSIYNQMTALGAEMEFDTVTGIEKNGTFKVKTEYGEFESLAVIAAVGVKHRKPDVKGYEQAEGCGISYCAVCDGNFYQGKNVCVYGGGDTALQDALLLSQVCAKVTVIHRRDELRAEKSLQDAAKQKGNIEFILSSTISEVISHDNAIVSVSVNTPEGEKIVYCSGLFVAIGMEANNGIFKDMCDLSENGYILSGEDCTTKTGGFFTAGDCRQKDVRQLTTAVADGSVAALAACRYIDNL